MKKFSLILLTATCLASPAFAITYPVSGRWGLSTETEPGPIDCEGKRVIRFDDYRRFDSGGGVPDYRVIDLDERGRYEFPYHGGISYRSDHGADQLHLAPDQLRPDRTRDVAGGHVETQALRVDFSRGRGPNFFAPARTRIGLTALFAVLVPIRTRRFRRPWPGAVRRTCSRTQHPALRHAAPG